MIPPEILLRDAAEIAGRRVYAMAKMLTIEWGMIERLGEVLDG
jgi:hypothetical protein